MDYAIELTLSYDGKSSTKHHIDLYDVSQALTGFQRSIALTTHLILNNQVIVQSPSLKGAQIHALPAEEGSWKITAAIILSGTYALGTASKDTVIGHIINSAYDYVISESLGFHVDYDKTLGLQYEEYNKNKKNKPIPKVHQYQLDSVIEKCSNSIKEMHRPIYKTETAENATISVRVNNEDIPLTPTLTMETYKHLEEEIEEDKPVIVEGYVSSYNSNTYRGRIYIPQEGRPIPFELSDKIQNDKTVKIILKSLRQNALEDESSEKIYCRVYKNKSKIGNLKGYRVVKVSKKLIDSN